MCTVSIHHSAKEVLVTFNRDELISRASEFPPIVHDGPPRWVAPKDSERGGTWMGANEHGVIACLLNMYMPGESLLPDPKHPLPTRGDIIPNLLQRGPAKTGIDWLFNVFDPARYPSFSVHVVWPEGSSRFIWRRNGGIETETVKGEWYVYSSSGWDSQDVTQWREDRFAQWLREGALRKGTLPDFHLIQEAGHEDRSPLMRREWSSTRSITQVRLNYRDHRVEMRYWARPTPRSEAPHATESIALNDEALAGSAKAVS